MTKAILQPPRFRHLSNPSNRKKHDTQNRDSQSIFHRPAHHCHYEEAEGRRGNLTPSLRAQRGNLSSCHCEDRSDAAISPRHCERSAAISPHVIARIAATRQSLPVIASAARQSLPVIPANNCHPRAAFLVGCPLSPRTSSDRVAVEYA